MPLAAAGNAASQWLSALTEQGELALPQTGLAGRLIDSYWLNVIPGRRLAG